MTSSFKLRGIEQYFWETYVRPMVFKRDNHSCVLCKSKKNLECHETNYKKITLSSIKTLCKNCHKKIHSWYNLK
jgi:5-methylcytosine-specific restriction endonuclease McrA